MIDAAEGWIVAVTGQVVHVRRHDVAVALETKFRCGPKEGSEIEVVDLADYGPREFQYVLL